MDEPRGGGTGPDGRFVLHRFNGDEVYRFRSAEMWLGRATDGGPDVDAVLWFELAADDDAIRRCEDTADAGMAPTAEVGIGLAVAEADVDRLVGRTFVMPGAADGEDSCMSLLYYYEHEPLRDNRITVLSRNGDRFRLRWTAVCEDVNFYDGSKPPTRVEIDGEFLFRDARS